MAAGNASQLSDGASACVLMAAKTAEKAGLEPLTVAKILAKVVAEEAPGLAIAGKQAIDNDEGAPKVANLSLAKYARPRPCVGGPKSSHALNSNRAAQMGPTTLREAGASV